VTNGDNVSAENRWSHAVWLAVVGVLATIIATAITASAQAIPGQADNSHRIVSLTSGHHDFRNVPSGTAGGADRAVYEQRADTDIDTDYVMRVGNPGW
jgi:hypothetical protein